MDLINVLEDCSNTLTSIAFEFCDFKYIFTFDKLLHLKRLQSLQFVCCQDLKTQNFQSLLDDPLPLKIKSLKVIGKTLGIELLLRKVGPYLENLELKLWKDLERNEAFKSMLNHCDRIKFLYIFWINHENIPRLYELIKINKHLKYLSIVNIFPSTSSTILKSLGPILPDSLEYLDLSLIINPNDLKVFLENCKHVVGLNKLLIRNGNSKDIVITFNVLRKFVKEEKIKNFTYQIDFNIDNLEQEFEKLANQTVGMKKYGDLVVNISYLDI